jgi:hypothetical protein
MIERKIVSKRSPPPRRPEPKDEGLNQIERQIDPDAIVFIRWAMDLYKSLLARIPKSYVIEEGEVFQNPEYATWRENLKSLISNLEHRIKKQKSIESHVNVRADRHRDIHDLYDKLLKLRHRSHG